MRSAVLPPGGRRRKAAGPRAKFDPLPPPRSVRRPPPGRSGRFGPQSRRSIPISASSRTSYFDVGRSRSSPQREHPTVLRSISVYLAGARAGGWLEGAMCEEGSLQEMRRKAHVLCKEYLNGSWSDITADRMIFRQVR